MEKGSVINSRYEVKSLLGRGGMGEVYRVHDSKTSHDLALKILGKQQPGSMSAAYQRTTSQKTAAQRTVSQKSMQLFRREFELLSRLSHPNIVKVLEFGEVAQAEESGSETLYYTMEYVEGQSLTEWIAALHTEKRSKETAVAALEVMLQLAKALRHVHENGVIHHDLKPENIIIVTGENGPFLGVTLKLLDFGIALLREAQQEEEIMTGTLHYKSPEQARGVTLDYTADIYSFGTLAYEILTGNKPFDLKVSDAVHPFALAHAVTCMHALKTVPLIKTIHPKVAKTMNRMVQICMEKEPQHRYQSMQEVEERIFDTLGEVGG